MFIAIAVNVIATPMVIEVAETPQQLADALVEWCVDEMGEPKPVDDTFHKEVIEACNAGFRDFTHVRGGAACVENAIRPLGGYYHPAVR